MQSPVVPANTSGRTRAVEGGRGPLRLAALALLLGGAAPGADAPRYPADSVLLLIAPWCAPCHAELARLDTIAAAARPRAVRVFMVEDGARAAAMWRRVPDAYRWTPPDGEVRRYRTDALARAAGLPFAIATDAQGRICATRDGGMDAARVVALIRAC